MLSWRPNPKRAGTKGGLEHTVLVQIGFQLVVSLNLCCDLQPGLQNHPSHRSGGLWKKVHPDEEVLKEKKCQGPAHFWRIRR